jgi:hypothetical protein
VGQLEKPKLEPLLLTQSDAPMNIRNAIKSAKTLAKRGGKYVKDVVVSVGLAE